MIERYTGATCSSDCSVHLLCIISLLFLQVVVCESDPFWAVYRHKHIAQVLPAISDAVKKFVVDKVAKTADQREQHPHEIKVPFSLTSATKAVHYIGYPPVQSNRTN